MDADYDNDGWSDGDLIPNETDLCFGRWNPVIEFAPDLTPTGAPTYTIAFELQGITMNTWLPAPHQSPYPAASQPPVLGSHQSSHVTVVAKLKDPDGVVVDFENEVVFQITYVSELPGVATNQAESSPPNDFSFDPNDRADTQHTFAVDPNTPVPATVDLYSFDYGGRVEIEATTNHSAGGSVSDKVVLPVDSDGDDLPDVWEIAHNAAGFDELNKHSFSAGKLDSDEDIDTSENNIHPPDGLTNFREYRGIIYDLKSLDGSTVTYTHERLAPNNKDLFVRGDGFYNSLPCRTTGSKPALCTKPNLLDFSVDYASVYKVPGGQSAFEEAGIAVHDVTGMPSFSEVDEPPFIDILVVTNRTEQNAQGFIETETTTFNGFINHPSEHQPRLWTWDLKGESYIGNHDFYAYYQHPDPPYYVKRGTFCYHLSTMHYFFNRPYDNQENTAAWQGSQCYQAGVYLDRLDPSDGDHVEDWVIENGNLSDPYRGKTEDNCIENQQLDGDHMVPGWLSIIYPGGSEYYEAGHDFSAFDADGDGLVENPRVANSEYLTHNTEWPFDSGEYSPEMVQMHTVLHEMGHGVGMNANHTSDETCLMYFDSIDWDRAGHFSTAARAEIKIHNSN
jgi:hypothetical protein